MAEQTSWLEKQQQKGKGKELKQTDHSQVTTV
jgi:hypothetical protein